MKILISPLTALEIRRVNSLQLTVNCGCDGGQEFISNCCEGGECWPVYPVPGIDVPG